jgi:transcriptional regulator of nitric oxide reductase
MRNAGVLVVIALLLAPALALPFAGTQASSDTTLQGQMKRVFPGATSFSTKQPGPPPHFLAYTGDAAARTTVGYVFWTTDVEPLERGYDGPIKMLVGVDTKGALTGVLVVEDHEPYGYFSVQPARFGAQFKGKDIRDPFKVGGDVDAVSGATITINSATRAIRNGARRIARSLITPPGTSK